MAENITGIANLTHPGKSLSLHALVALIKSTAASWDALCPAFDALATQTFT